MAVNYYVKYYPRDITTNPYLTKRDSWDYSTFFYCDKYDTFDSSGPSGTPIVYTIDTFAPGRQSAFDAYTDYNTAYGNLSFFLAMYYVGGLKPRYYSSNYNYNLNYWTSNTYNWSPTILTTFRDNCITFIGNNNPSNWTHINLDLWFNETPYPGKTHYFPVYYNGNNPAADYTVTI